MPPKPTPEQLALRGFIKRVEDNPADTEAWLGYGKLLAAKRDVRAESIQRWHEKHDFDAFVIERAGDLFGEYATDVGPEKLFRVTWHMGFVKGIRVCVPGGGNREKVQARLSGLLKQPVFMLMREFRVELLGGGSTYWYTLQIRPTSIHNIRTIGFEGIVDTDDRWSADLEIDWTNFAGGGMDNSKWGGSSQDARGPSGLERIELAGRFRIPTWKGSVGNCIPPQLRELVLMSDNFIPGDVSALATWQLPKLERLEIWFQSKISYANEDDLARLFAAPWPALRVLALGCTWADDVVEALVKSPLLDQLTELDLGHNDLSEAHVKALAERAPNLRLRHGSSS